MTRYLEVKSGSISEVALRLRDDYQAIFKAELEKAGKGLAQMSDSEKKAFFNKIDKMHNAKSEQAPATKQDDSKTTMVVKPGAPAGQEKVIRIPKEKLGDYKLKGYVEAESYIPEAKKIDELTAGQKKLPPALQKAIKAKEKKEEVEINEGGFKDIDVRKGDLKLAKDKREQLKNKYNAIMANAMKGDESTIADQIQKLDMSIKKQEQELIDIMKKGKENEKNEAYDTTKASMIQQKIQKMTSAVGALDKSKPENKTKEAILKSDITTAKLRLQDLMQKSAAQVKKAVNEMSKAKQSYKSLKMSMKKEQEMNGKKKTLTDKPITKIDVNPKVES